MQDEKLIVETKQLKKQTAHALLDFNVDVISKNIHTYWVNHVNEIRQALSMKGQSIKGGKSRKVNNIATKDAMNKQQLEQTKKFHTAKDLLFIQSELSSYLKQDNIINYDFLDMIVSVLSIRNIHNPYLYNDELLLFGTKSVTNLIPKVKKGDFKPELLDKIMQLFMVLNLKKAREQLSVGLCKAMSGQHQSMIGAETLKLIVEMTKLKRGVADMELDCDNAIKAIKRFIEQETKELFSLLELSALTYCIVYLCQNEEFSVREYAEHALGFVLKKLAKNTKEEQINLV